jgi:hypothetical protein
MGCCRDYNSLKEFDTGRTNLPSAGLDSATKMESPDKKIERMALLPSAQYIGKKNMQLQGVKMIDQS